MEWGCHTKKKVYERCTQARVVREQTGRVPSAEQWWGWQRWWRWWCCWWWRVLSRCAFVCECSVGGGGCSCNHGGAFKHVGIWVIAPSCKQNNRPKNMWDELLQRQRQVTQHVTAATASERETLSLLGDLAESRRQAGSRAVPMSRASSASTRVRAVSPRLSGLQRAELAARISRVSLWPKRRCRGRRR